MAVLRPDKKQAFLEGPACGRSSYCVVSPTLWSSRNSLCRKKLQRKQKDLQERKQKQRHTKLWAEEGWNFAAKGRLERTVLGVQTKIWTCKKLLCHQRRSHNCPMKEGEKSMKPVESFSLWIQALLCLCLLGTTEGWLWTPGSNGKHSASIFAWTPLTFSARIFLLPRSGNTTQSDLNATFYDRGYLPPENRMFPHVK